MLCTKCKEDKPIDRFIIKKDRKNQFCKDCHNAFCRKKWKDRRVKAIELLGNKCNKCGYDKNYAALEFHHLDPSTKEANWNQIRKWAWSKLVEELKKCILLCANCHRELHNPNDIRENYTGIDNLLLNKVEITPTGKCLICDEDVYGTIYCSRKCSNFGQRKVKRPSKETLEKDIEQLPFTTIGKKYGVSDNTIRKWAKDYNIKIEKKLFILEDKKCLLCNNNFKPHNKKQVYCSKNCYRNSKKPIKEELIRSIKELDLKEVVDKYNVNRSTIRRWLIYYDLPTKIKEVKQI